MSDQLYLLVAVGGTFAAVVCAGVAWLVMAKTRRPSAVLQAQLQSAGIVAPPRSDVTPGSRVMGQTVSGLANMASRVAPRGARERTAHQLVLAGSPKGWTAERVLAMRALLAVFGALSGNVLGQMSSSGPFRILVPAIFALMGFVLPGATLSQAVMARQERIRRMLPDTIDLLTISVEAGLSFDAALLHVRRTVKGPLSEEIGRMLHEVQLGVRRPDAMRSLAARTSVDELKGFVLAMVQADTFGVSIAAVLRAQSRELRIKRRQRAEERAMKIPVKLLFPMIFCIMPALFVVIVGPGALQIYDSLISGNGLF
jgi:tight adherence protein C